MWARKAQGSGCDGTPAPVRYRPTVRQRSLIESVKMKIGITAEPHARGIRPILRYGLLGADLALSVAAVAFATEIADVHSATVRQLGLVALILFVAGSYAQFRYESARTCRGR